MTIEFREDPNHYVRITNVYDVYINKRQVGWFGRERNSGKWSGYINDHTQEFASRAECQAYFQSVAAMEAL